jgi:hypothetical protein
MHLGTLIARLEHENNAAVALEALGDIVLFTAVSEAGSRYEESPGAYAAGAVARFANGAGDEDWVSLIGHIERADDPGHAALVRMLQWALALDAVDGEGEGQTTCTCGAPHALEGLP